MSLTVLLLHPHFFFLTVELGGRRQLLGPRAAPGREEAEPARVGGACPGLRLGGGPGCTAASAWENFLGTASPGRSPRASSVRPPGGMEPLHLLVMSVGFSPYVSLHKVV